MRQQLATGAFLLAAGKYISPTSTTARTHASDRNTASLATAQYPGGSNDDGSHGNPYSSGNYNPFSSGDGDDNGSPFGGSNGDGGGGGFFNNIQDQVFTRYNGMVTAHAIMAAVAFGFIFPFGGILIRLASFPRLWLVHGLVQLVAYFLYIAAFALGIYMASHARLLNNAHPILGIVVFILIIFQPVLGFVHHVAFKKYSRRTVWSYAHLWMGRIAITLGIINGGLGLQLSERTRIFSPSQGAIIGYSVAAGVMWLLWVASAIYGERKRSRQGAANAEVAPPPKYSREAKDSDSDRDGRPVQYA